MMHSAIEDSKRSRRDLRILWLDLQNAFGSVPHATMWDMLQRLSVPPSFISLCKTIYENSGHHVIMDAGKIQFIKQTKGIKQGCPLSPLLFNSVMEGLSRGIHTLSGVGYQFINGRLAVNRFGICGRRVPIWQI